MLTPDRCYLSPPDSGDLKASQRAGAGAGPDPADTGSPARRKNH